MTNIKRDKRISVISNDETFRNYFISLPAYSLVIWLMRSPKNFEKRANLKIWQLISIWWSKTHFGKTPLKWCLFRHEKNWSLPIWLSNSLCPYKMYSVSYLHDTFIIFWDYNISKWQLLLQRVNISITK